MSKIQSVRGREILDSRGNPTVAVTLTTENATVEAFVPSGASTGEHEAIELRDGDAKRYFGKGVLKAVGHVNKELSNLLIGKDVHDQEGLDRAMIDLDGTENKAQFGANAILGCSMAIAKASAEEKGLPLFKSLVDSDRYILPVPMLNILNGGAHADNTLDFQEFMIRPVGASSFSESIRMSAEIFHTLKKILKSEGHSTAVGDEGGFAPNLETHEQTLELIVKAIEHAGYEPGHHVTIALDAAASYMFEKEENCYCERKRKLANRPSQNFTSEQVIDQLEHFCNHFPIDSIEDGLDENDWTGWISLHKRLGENIQIVGDDLFVTNPKFLDRGIKEKAANSILIKLNQIGTLTETLETINLAHANNFKCVISHRSGETEDTFIADLAVATGAGQIKTGSLSRSERTAKYNRLMAIESILLFFEESLV